jgi:hypothetical protein
MENRWEKLRVSMAQSPTSLNLEQNMLLNALWQFSRD